MLSVNVIVVPGAYGLSVPSACGFAPAVPFVSMNTCPATVAGGGGVTVVVTVLVLLFGLLSVGEVTTAVFVTVPLTLAGTL